MSLIMKLLGKPYLSFNSWRGKYKLKNILPDSSKTIRSALMYHGIGDNEWQPLDVSKKAFFEEINFYQQQGYVIQPSLKFSADDLETPSLAITFDDGNRNIFPVLKQLIKQKIPFLIAICPGVIDNNNIYWFEELLARIQILNNDDLNSSMKELELCKSKYFNRIVSRQQLLDEYRAKTKEIDSPDLTASQAVHENLSWSELKEIVDSGYCEIASHTLYHDAITTLTTEEFKLDLNACQKRIEQELNLKCEQFVCPFGDYSMSYQKILDDCGYKQIFLSNNKINIGNSDNGKIIDRLKGVGLGNFSLRYFEFLWLQNHREA